MTIILSCAYNCDNVVSVKHVQLRQTIGSKYAVDFNKYKIFKRCLSVVCAYEVNLIFL